jgi:hypothetical protein
MREIAGIISLNALFVCAGYGVLVAARARSTLADLGTAFCAGVAAVLLVLCLLAVAGYVPGVVATVVVAALLASPLARPRLRPRRFWPGVRAIRLRGWQAALTLGFAAAAAVYAVALIRLSRVDLFDEYDAFALWTMKAKALVVFNDLKTADFTGAGHPDYPILVPMLQSLVFRFVGRFDTQIVHVEHALLLLGFVGAGWRMVGRLLPRAAAAAWAVFILTLPGVERNVPDALADVPVAVFVALALICLHLWLLGEERHNLVLFVLFGAAACWTKNEGWTALAAIGIAALVVEIGRPRLRIASLLAAFAAVIALALPWRIWTKVVGAHYDTNLAKGLDPRFLYDRRDRIGPSFQALWQQVGNGTNWAFVAYVLLALAVVAIVLRRRTRLAILHLVAPALMIAAYAWVYVVRDDPLGFTWMVQTSASRIATTVGLAMATAVPLLCSALLGDAPTLDDRVGSPS